MSETPNINIDIIFKSELWQRQVADIEEVINNFCKQAIVSTDIGKFASKIELSVILTDDESIKKLNLEYRGVDKATNVLSFPNQELSVGEYNSLKIYNDFIMLGDILIAYETIEREAKAQNKKLVDHFSHMLIHGVLHLLGYDHENDVDACVMEQLEIAILARFSIESPYKLVQTIN
jgi:probable rRNA maturation factor